MAVALLGLLSAALVTGAARLVSNAPKTPEEVFWTAAREARHLALKLSAEARLRYDSKDKKFLVDSGATTEEWPIPDARDISIDLLRAQIQSGAGTVLIGGQLVDTQTLAAVTFYSDGTCSPFRVQFRATGPARVISIDPWTCAPVLESKTP